MSDVSFVALCWLGLVCLVGLTGVDRDGYDPDEELKRLEAEEARKPSSAPDTAALVLKDARAATAEVEMLLTKFIDEVCQFTLAQHRV